MRCLLLLAVAIGCTAAVVRVPIGHRPSLKQQMYAEGKLEAYLKEKAEKMDKNSELATGKLSMLDLDDLAYFSYMTVGTPAQQFVTFIDTGSSNFWVADESCAAGSGHQCGDYCGQTSYDACVAFCAPTCCKKSQSVLPTANPCATKNRFKNTTSTTYQKNGTVFDITYQTGNVKGFYGVDTVCVANTTVCAQKQIFGQATSMGADFGAQPMDGILGLAFPSLAYNHYISPIWSAFQQGTMQNAIFTIFMKNVGQQISANGGQLTFGGYDHDNCAGQYDIIPLTSKTFWQFTLQGFGVGSYQQSQSKGWTAITNSASTYIGGPTAYVAKLAAAVGATFNNQYQGYFMDCDANTPDITLTINAKTYRISAKNYIISVGPGPCQFAFFPMQGGGFYPQWMIGPPLFREYCVAHDFKSGTLGLAKAN